MPNQSPTTMPEPMRVRSWQVRPWRACVLLVFLALCGMGCARQAQPSPSPTATETAQPSPSASPGPSTTVFPTQAGAVTVSPWGTGTPATGLTVDLLHRESSAAFFHQRYVISEPVEIAWTGNHVACDEGIVSPAFRKAVRQRLNYFRLMAGVPSVQFDPEFNRLAQKGALMLSVNDRISHATDPSWVCYSEDGASGAKYSALYLGVYGWKAIDGYIEDGGDSNFFVPHRRDLLFPWTEAMGSGDIPPVEGYKAANAVWVVGPMADERPVARDGFVAWPPPGYVPYQVVYPRWSLSYLDANFSLATASMTLEGQEVPVTVREVVDGVAESTIVWEPQIALGQPPQKDLWYTLRVDGVQVGEFEHNLSYVVIVYNPG